MLFVKLLTSLAATPALACAASAPAVDACPPPATTSSCTSYSMGNCDHKVVLLMGDSLIPSEFEELSDYKGRKKKLSRSCEAATT